MQVCQKEGFSLKNAPIGHRSISLQSGPSLCSQYVPKSSHYGQLLQNDILRRKLHSSAIALLESFDLFFAGSQVATVFVTSHTYHIY